jgi:hypothetical protein
MGKRRKRPRETAVRRPVPPLPGGRVPIPRPGHAHEDRSKYDRKRKEDPCPHDRAKFIGWQEGMAERLPLWNCSICGTTFVGPDPEEE